MEVRNLSICGSPRNKLQQLITAIIKACCLLRQQEEKFAGMARASVCLCVTLFVSVSVCFYVPLCDTVCLCVPLCHRLAVPSEPEGPPSRWRRPDLSHVAVFYISFLSVCLFFDRTLLAEVRWELARNQLCAWRHIPRLSFNPQMIVYLQDAGGNSKVSEVHGGLRDWWGEETLEWASVPACKHLRLYYLASQPQAILPASVTAPWTQK